MGSIDLVGGQEILFEGKGVDPLRPGLDPLMPVDDRPLGRHEEDVAIGLRPRGREQLHLISGLLQGLVHRAHHFAPVPFQVSVKIDQQSAAGFHSRTGVLQAFEGQDMLRRRFADESIVDDDIVFRVFPGPKKMAGIVDDHFGARIESEVLYGHPPDPFVDLYDLEVHLQVIEPVDQSAAPHAQQQRLATFRVSGGKQGDVAGIRPEVVIGVFEIHHGLQRIVDHQAPPGKVLALILEWHVEHFDLSQHAFGMIVDGEIALAPILHFPAHCHESQCKKTGRHHSQRLPAVQ